MPSQVAEGPRAVRRVGGVRQQAVEVGKGGAAPRKNPTVWSEFSEVGITERLRHGLPIGSVEPPENRGGGGRRGGLEAGAA